MIRGLELGSKKIDIMIRKLAICVIIKIFSEIEVDNYLKCNLSV